MNRQLSDSRLANLAASLIFQAFTRFQAEFQAISARARQRFEQSDWHAMQTDAAARLDLYKQVVDPTLLSVRAQLGERGADRLVWAGIKAVYSGLIAGRDDWELAETFYNSITRRMFATVGVDPHIEFVDTDFDSPPTHPHAPVYLTFNRQPSTTALLNTILTKFAFATPFADLNGAAAQVAGRVEQKLRQLGALKVVERAEVVSQVFYRNKGAYLVGRLYSGAHLVPFVLALLNTPAGVTVDAVLLDEDDVSILFSFAHSYFHVFVARPHDLVTFLKSIMPRKRIAELYISLGYNKHGKTELYRDLLHHLSVTADLFEIAQGARGMVMTVFTLPTYDLVFKIIKDRFGFPKNTTRREVMDKYRLVFRHDRAGRLVDAQEFEHLQFDRARFSPALLQELQQTAGKSVEIHADTVVIKHLYIERRLTPLDIYVTDASEAAAQAAVTDYGQCIKDLAGSNIFPGDILLKNFGVTRHGRVVFYDYDELCELTACRFRKMPAARTHDDEISAEPWFFVDENDIFPEEFRTFLGLQGALRDLFTAAHGDLFTSEYWNETQQRLCAGEVIDIYPYHPRCRLSAHIS